MLAGIVRLSLREGLLGQRSLSYTVAFRGGCGGVRTAPGDTLRGVTPELVFSVKKSEFFKIGKQKYL